MEISVNFKQQHPVNLDVNISCGQGEMLVLVGPSGSGKSSILHAIAGLIKPDKGKIQCKGSTWFDSDKNMCLSPQARKIGIVFQHYALFPHLTALENVKLPIRELSAIEAQKKAMDIFARVNLKGFEDRYPSMLSGGQQQRVALARALARNPEVLLLDEPFSAVDQVTRRKLRLEMAGLVRNLNIPIIFVTHDLDEASMLADKLCVVHNGMTLQSGPVDEILKRPANSTVARLIDVRNIFIGQIKSHNEDINSTILDWQGVELEIPLCPEYQVNETVHWCIAPSEILLHRRVQPSRGEKENPVFGEITDLVIINGIANVILELNSEIQNRLFMEIPVHVARRNFLSAGEKTGVSLLKQAIHVMKS